MIEFKIISKKTNYDCSKFFVIRGDGKYYMAKHKKNGILYEPLDLDKYTIIETKHHYPYYSIND